MSGTSEKEFQESGEKHDAVNAQSEDLSKKYAAPEPAKKPYNPLTGEAVNEKSYARPNIKISAQEASAPIPEPIMAPPPPKKEEGAEGAKKPPEPVNPQLKDLPSKEKEMASKQAAAMAINAYEALNQLGNHVIKIPERKVKKLVKAGSLNLSMPVPVNGGRTIPLSQFIEAYNKETGDTFKVSPQFKEEVTPVLERYFEKKGIGASDEQALMYIVGKDLIVKTVQAAALIKSRNEVLNQLVELTESYNKGVRPQAQPQQPMQQQEYQQHTTPQPATQQEYKPTPPPASFDDDDAEIIEPEIIPNEQVLGDYVDTSASKSKKDKIVDISDSQPKDERVKRAYNKKK